MEEQTGKWMGDGHGWVDPYGCMGRQMSEVDGEIGGGSVGG